MNSGRVQNGHRGSVTNLGFVKRFVIISETSFPRAGTFNVHGGHVRFVDDSDERHRARARFQNISYACSGPRSYGPFDWFNSM